MFLPILLVLVLNAFAASPSQVAAAVAALPQYGVVMPAETYEASVTVRRKIVPVLTTTTGWRYGLPSCPGFIEAQISYHVGVAITGRSAAETVTMLAVMVKVPTGQGDTRDIVVSDVGLDGEIDPEFIRASDAGFVSPADAQLVYDAVITCFLAPSVPAVDGNANGLGLR